MHLELDLMLISMKITSTLSSSSSSKGVLLLILLGCSASALHATFNLLNTLTFSDRVRVRVCVHTSLLRSSCVVNIFVKSKLDECPLFVAIYL